jgi:geranylgeranyl diphosphate synthase type I
MVASTAARLSQSIDSLEARLAELGELVGAWTREAVEGAFQAPAEQFGDMVAYHLGWRDTDLAELAVPAPSGKKLRPAIALLVSEAVCGSIEPARAAAVALELVHNFSLVHDDIQDRSHLRRHRPTLWSLWGMAQGINAGDALFALAQLALMRQQKGPTAAMSVALNTACLRLVEGQFLDLQMQQARVLPALELYEAMITRKTGALFEAAGRLGAMAAGAAEEIQRHYASYGLHLGVAFQEQDDILGVWGSASETGKPDAADVIARKKGLPAVLALSRPDVPAWLISAYTTDEDMPRAKAEHVIEHFDMLGLRGQAERRVAERYGAALTALEEAGGREPARSHLAAICESLVSRRS